MTSSLARLTELLYDKAGRPRGPRAFTGPDPGSVAIRRMPIDVRTPHERLAALDSSPVLEGEVLVAFVDDEPWAAISLHDGRVVADPFRPSAHAVELLRVRARHLQGQPRAGAVGGTRNGLAAREALGSYHGSRNSA